jgi:hypothetical protein
MRYRNIALIAVATVLAATIGIIRSQAVSTSEQIAPVGFSTLQELQSVAHLNLPVEDFDDRSLVFPRKAKS